jgi:hypothetical protein
MLQNIIKWYKTGNTDLLLENKEFIINLKNNDDITLFVEYLIMKNIKNDELLNCIKSLKFLIENNIINPNKCYYTNNIEYNNCEYNIILLLYVFINHFGHVFEEYENEMKDLVDFLFDHMDPKCIKYHTDEEHLFFHAIHHAFIPNKYYEYLYDKIMATGVTDDFHIDFKYTGKETIDLNRSVKYCRKKYIDIALNAGDDINYIFGKYDFISDYNGANLAQILLLDNDCIKNEENINKVIDILLYLIDKGINKNHTNIYGRNLMDLIFDFGWYDIKIDHSNLYDILINLGINERTNIKLPVREWEIRSENDIENKTTEAMILLKENKTTEAMILLKENKYVKTPDKIKDILNKLIKMKEYGVDFKLKDYKGLNIYEKYCSKYNKIGILTTPVWENTIVSDFLKKECV